MKQKVTPFNELMKNELTLKETENTFFFFFYKLQKEQEEQKIQWQGIKVDLIIKFRDAVDQRGNCIKKKLSLGCGFEFPC